MLRLFEMLWAIWKYGQREQPVVIDVYSTLNFYYALYCSYLCRMLGIRYYCILRGGNLPARLQNSPWLCQHLFVSAAKLIAPSGYLQNAFSVAKLKAEVISNFIPIANYPFKERRYLRPRLLWVRAFDATYNPHMAIRVLHQLSHQYPEATLCMVGPDKDGSMVECQHLAKELDLGNRVRFTGRLPKQEWIEISSEFDIFLNTTNFDNTPVSVLEAMALGFPIISTNVGGIPFVIEHNKNGILVQPQGEIEMCQAISFLANNPEITSQLSINARRSAELYDLQNIRPKWMEILSDF